MNKDKIEEIISQLKVITSKLESEVRTNQILDLDYNEVIKYYDTYPEETE